MDAGVGGAIDRQALVATVAVEVGGLELAVERRQAIAQVTDDAQASTVEAQRVVAVGSAARSTGGQEERARPVSILASHKHSWSTGTLAQRRQGRDPAEPDAIDHRQRRPGQDPDVVGLPLAGGDRQLVTPIAVEVAGGQGVHHRAERHLGGLPGAGRVGPQAHQRARATDIQLRLAVAVEVAERAADPDGELVDRRRAVRVDAKQPRDRAPGRCEPGAPAIAPRAGSWTRAGHVHPPQLRFAWAGRPKCVVVVGDHLGLTIAVEIDRRRRARLPERGLAAQEVCGRGADRGHRAARRGTTRGEGQRLDRRAIGGVAAWTAGGQGLGQLVPPPARELDRDHRAERAGRGGLVGRGLVGRGGAVEGRFERAGGPLALGAPQPGLGVHRRALGLGDEPIEQRGRGALVARGAQPGHLALEALEALGRRWRGRDRGGRRRGAQDRQARGHAGQRHEDEPGEGDARRPR
jgi:hypothetical protein